MPGRDRRTIVKRYAGRRTKNTVTIDQATIECVLLDHLDEYSGPAGTQDTSLAELAHVYRELTGFDAVCEWERSS